MFGREAVNGAVTEVIGTLTRQGYRSHACDLRTRTVVCELLLRNRSSRLADLTDEALARLRADAGFTAWAGGALHGVHRALAALGYASPPGLPTRGWPMPVEGAPAAWMEAVDRWYGTSTLTPAVRREYRSILSKVGRWMTQEQTGVAAPGDWTRATCAAYVARVDRMLIGDFAQRRSSIEARSGQPLAPTSKASYISVVRGFFREGHEHGWCPPRFDPSIALVTPRAVKALIFPKPRIIADDALGQAGLGGAQPDADDLPARGRVAYPLALVRALALTWLFIGQRSDEIARLRVGCIRWQHDGQPIAGDAADASPTTPSACSTSQSTRPAPPSPSPSIRSSARPSRPGRLCGRHSRPLLDRKTGEHVALAVLRPRRAGRKTYINHTIIPALCAKAGVPTSRRPRPHHQPPGPLHHRHPALQRQGADDAVRAAGLARPPHPGRPSTTPRSPRTRWPRPTPTPATSPATCAPSRC